MFSHDKQGSKQKKTEYISLMCIRKLMEGEAGSGEREAEKRRREAEEGGRSRVGERERDKERKEEIEKQKKNGKIHYPGPGKSQRQEFTVSECKHGSEKEDRGTSFPSVMK